MSRVIFPALRTGGPLNRINEKYRLNKRADTVAIMQLVDAHKPKTESEVLALLESHKTECSACACRVRNGGLSAWAERLFAAAQRERHSCTAEQCHNFMYDLFVRGPLRGRMTEQTALGMLRADFEPALTFAESEPDVDARFAVDIVVDRTASGTVAGIQVKPTSYKHTAQYVREANVDKNRLFGHPVHYMYYDRTGMWENYDAVAEVLRSVSRGNEVSNTRSNSPQTSGAIM